MRLLHLREDARVMFASPDLSLVEFVMDQHDALRREQHRPTQRDAGSAKAIEAVKGVFRLRNVVWQKWGQRTLAFESASRRVRGRPAGLTQAGRCNVFSTMAWKRGDPSARSCLKWSRMLSTCSGVNGSSSNVR